MAKFKSAIITQASGSIGGLTMSHNGSGMYIRSRSIPTNPSTSRQQVIRNAQSTLSQRWATVLTETQRELWRQYSSNVSRKNKLGDVIYLSGIAMYVRCNVVRIQIGTAIVDDAPSVYTIGDGLEGATLVQATVTPFAVNLTWTGTDFVANDLIVVYASIPKNQSVNYFKGPYRLNLSGTAIEGTRELVPNPAWVAGQRIFVQVRVSYADGRLSDPQRFVVDLTAAPI